MKLIHGLICVLLFSPLAACQSTQDLTYRNGPDVDFPAATIQAQLDRQNTAVNLFISYTLGPDAQPRTNDDWHAVAKTGFNYVHGVCDDYLGLIERLQRDKDATDKGLGAISIATTSILTISKSYEALKYLAASLGLASSLNDDVFERYLFAQNVSVVKGRVDDLMGAYEKTIEAQILSSRADLVVVVRNDLAYCTPAVIEANLTSAIRTASVNVNTAAGAPVNTPGTSFPAGGVAPSKAGLSAKATLSNQ